MSNGLNLAGNNSIKDLIETIKDLNKNYGKAVYILLIDDIMLASTRKYDINKLLSQDPSLFNQVCNTRNRFNAGTRFNDFVLIYGVVLSPEELPLEKPKNMENYDIIVIKKEPTISRSNFTTWESFTDIEDATEWIESWLEADSDYDIEDSSVLIGNEENFMIQVSDDIKTIDFKE
jgi:hypothetical protein